MNIEKTYITERMLLELPQDLSYLEWFVLWFLFENTIGFRMHENIKSCFDRDYLNILYYEGKEKQLVEIYDTHTVEILEFLDLHKKNQPFFKPTECKKLNRVLFMIFKILELYIQIDPPAYFETELTGYDHKKAYTYPHRDRYVSKRYVSDIYTRKSDICNCVPGDERCVPIHAGKYMYFYKHPYQGFPNLNTHIIQINADFPSSINIECTCCYKGFDVYPIKPNNI